jgi:voltage-gated potassium channel
MQRERALTSDVAFRFAAIVTLLVVVVTGAVKALVDSGDFHSTWDGIWWAVVTVTTVGYGDVLPRTVGGKVIAIVVMLVGIGFLSVLTATIASKFVQTERTGESEQLLAALQRIEAELAEVRQRLDRASG